MSAAATAPRPPSRKLIYPDTKAEDAPARVEALLKRLSGATAPNRPKASTAFANRHEVEALKGLAQAYGRGTSPRRGRSARMSAAPQITVTIPDTAPFSPEQRAWLSGFFSASISVAADGPAEGPADGLQTIRAPPRRSAGPFSPATTRRPGTTPPWSRTPGWRWPRTSRSRRASWPPWRSRIAASAATIAPTTPMPLIFGKNEERLNLCAPGGKVTARLLKGLAVELNDINGDKTAADVGAAEGGKSPRRGKRPGRRRPRHVARGARRPRCSARGAASTRRGPSQGHLAHRVRPVEERRELQSSATASACSPRTTRASSTRSSPCWARPHVSEVNGKTLRQVLREDVDLGLAPDSLFELLLLHLGRQEPREGPGAGQAARIRTATPPSSTCWPCCTSSPTCGRTPKPSSTRCRRCSRASTRSRRRRTSMLGGLSLTVDAVRYQINKRRRTGVASTFLADSRRARRGVEGLRPEGAQFHAAGGPFQAGHHGRARHRRGAVPRLSCRSGKASGAPGKNWLFFGHQKSGDRFLLPGRDSRPCARRAC